MRVSINASDDQIVIDGKAGTVGCSTLRADGIAAVQWHGDHGEIEYVGHAKPNEKIDDFSPYQEYADSVEFPEPPPEPEVHELKEPPPPRHAPPTVFLAKLAPIEKIAWEHENRLRRLENQEPMSEDTFRDNLHQRIVDYVADLK